MRVLVCGDRNWIDAELLFDTLDSLERPLVVVEGGARGADRLARAWAQARDVPWEEYPADWSHRGKAAGPIRNQQMLDTGPDVVIAFHDDLDGSKGTRDMVSRALKANVAVRVVTHHGTRIIAKELRRTQRARDRTPTNAPANGQLRFNADGT